MATLYDNYRLSNDVDVHVVKFGDKFARIVSKPDECDLTHQVGQLDIVPFDGYSVRVNEKLAELLLARYGEQGVPLEDVKYYIYPLYDTQEEAQPEDIHTYRVYFDYDTDSFEQARELFALDLQFVCPDEVSIMLVP